MAFFSFLALTELGTPVVGVFPIGSPPVTGLAPVASISKNGAAFVVASNPVTEIAGTGYYVLPLGASDLDTLGTALVRILSAQPAETLVVQVRSVVNREILGLLRTQFPQLLADVMKVIVQSGEIVVTAVKNQVASLRGMKAK